MKKLIVHVGAHRTATTFVQRAMLSNAEALACTGISYKAISPDVAKVLIELRQSSEQEVIERSAIAFSNRYCTELDFAIASWEGLLGMPFANRSLYGARAAYIAMLKRAQDILACPVEIVLTVRRQDGFINSWYAQMIKTGYAEGRGAYLSEIDDRSLNWQPIIDDFRRSFDGVRVLPYEAMLDVGGKAFVGSLFKSAPIDLSSLTIEEDKKNSSYNATSLLISEFTNKYAQFDREQRRAFRKLLERMVEDTRPADILGPKLSQEIVARYKHANGLVLSDSGATEKVMERYGIAPPKRPSGFVRIRAALRKAVGIP